MTEEGPQPPLSEPEPGLTDEPLGLGALAKEKLGEFLKIPSFGRRGAALVAALAAIAWASTGLYKVQPDEQGVILRFGRWVETTPPGLHFHLPWPIETAMMPRVTQVNQLQLGAAAANASRDKQMLTGDENIVEADCAIVWQIKDAGLYLFKVAEPEAALRVAAESALREVIARTPIQSALSDRRQQIADETRNVLQKLLDAEEAGISVMQVQLQRVDPPITVIDAFNDVQRARADQERARNEAEAYANDILPRARGEAERIRQEAEAYRAQAVNLAEGDAKNFLSIYQSYAQAKDVTAWRLYLESVDEVLKKSSRVIVDSSGKGVSGVLPYMPIGEAKPHPGAANGAQK
ncbi:FtsH protease activity modulator HflK [Rhodoblastus sphagnicola]|uniref:FtsH protease activity modulator HflK n=1 Tax=Rhodoblastus sphagnicola TaxID=333368 RepID=UPI0026802E97